MQFATEPGVAIVRDPRGRSGHRKLKFVWPVDNLITWPIVGLHDEQVDCI